MEGLTGRLLELSGAGGLVVGLKGWCSRVQAPLPVSNTLEAPEEVGGFYLSKGYAVVPRGSRVPAPWSTPNPSGQGAKGPSGNSETLHSVPQGHGGGYFYIFYFFIFFVKYILKFWCPRTLTTPN